MHFAESMPKISVADTHACIHVHVFISKLKQFKRTQKIQDTHYSKRDLIKCCRGQNYGWLTIRNDILEFLCCITLRSERIRWANWHCNDPQGKACPQRREKAGSGLITQDSPVSFLQIELVSNCRGFAFAHPSFIGTSS